MKAIICTDHLGNEYPSLAAKCRAYNVTERTYKKRISEGYTEKEALTMSKTDRFKCTDHLGNEYLNVDTKCKAYGIKRKTYLERIKSGMSEEEALTLPLQNKRTCTDHLGNTFSSTEEKCKFYNVIPTVYSDRIKRGYTEEEALFSSNINECTDHLGNVFPSIEEKCNHYNITSSSYHARKRRGWDEERILTTPLETKRKRNKFCTDHLGNEYPSLTAKCDAYNITVAIYNYRIGKGCSEEEALTMEKSQVQTYPDPVTGELLTQGQIAKRYNISYKNYCNRLSSGYTMVQAINLSPHVRRVDLKCNKIVYNLRIYKRIKIGKDVFECYIINSDGSETFKIMSQEMIDNYCVEQYRKEKGII